MPVGLVRFECYFLSVLHALTARPLQTPIPLEGSEVRPGQYAFVPPSACSTPSAGARGLLGGRPGRRRVSAVMAMVVVSLSDSSSSVWTSGLCVSQVERSHSSTAPLLIRTRGRETTRSDGQHLPKTAQYSGRVYAQQHTPFLAWSARPLEVPAHPE